MASAAPTTPAGGGSSVAGGGGGGGRGLGEGTAAVGTVISGEDDVRQLEAALSKRRRQFSAHHLKVCMQVDPSPLTSPPSTTSPTHRECTTGMRARVPGTMQASSLVHYTSRGTTACHDSKQCPSTCQAEFALHDRLLLLPLFVALLWLPGQVQVCLHVDRQWEQQTCEGWCGSAARYSH